MTKPLPNVKKAFHIVLQEEKERGLHTIPSITSQSAAFHSHQNNWSNNGNRRGTDHQRNQSLKAHDRNVL